MGVVLVVCCAVTVTPSTPRRHLVTAAVALAVAVQAVVLYAPEAPGPPSPIPHGDKAVHAMVFALPVLVAGLGRRGWWHVVVALCAVHAPVSEIIQHAARAIADWIQFYNTRRPHQALAMRTPAEAFRLAA